MQTLRIAMLGGRGVGKTSLLAGMYDQFNFGKLVGANSLRLHAEPQTSARLDKRLKELRLWERDLDEEVGPPPTTETISFLFELGEKERGDSFRLEFVDYPGGWIEDEPEKVMQILKPCSVVLVAINTPALMEATGDWSHLHKVENKPLLIKDIFVALCKQVRHPYLVLFIPLKCERYVQNADEAQRLLQRVKEGYKETFEFLQDKSHLPKFAVVITPVQTLGSVVSTRLVSNKDDQKAPTPPGDYRFHFEKVPPGAQYKPTDTDQPLRYVLNFLLKEHLEHKRNWSLFNNTVGRPMRRIWSGFRREDSKLNLVLDALDSLYKLRQAIQPFAEDCKDKPPFQIVQGRSLLLKPL